MKPVISVVIPCYNEVNYIVGCVESIINNGFDSEQLEIIVVDGGSTDGTIQKLEDLKTKYRQVAFLKNPERITPVSMNMGIHAANGHYLLISSAHASFSTGYLTELKGLIENTENTIAVGGVMQTLVKNSHVVSESIRTVLMHPVGVGNAKFRTGVGKVMEVDTVPFGLYRADVLKESGGYNTRLVRNHDMELSKRLMATSGGKILLTPNAVCNYFARENYKAMARNNFNNGKWNLKTVWITRTFSSLSLRHFIPMLFLLSWLSPILLGIIVQDLRWSFLSLFILCTYVLSLSYFSFKALNGKNRWINVLLAFVLLHFAYGLGSMVGLMTLPLTQRNAKS